MPYVIGTAGHVDHGKSTLVEALTGIDPDRLAEEKAREMTIDLGFAWMTLPSGKQVGIVDVPGHRDFIENMLAGIGGIDMALLVIAADEGVMPQTREHLSILDLLEVPGGVVALTKVDLIDDPEWLELVALDVATALAGTRLAEAPIIPVSARSGEGLEELVATVDAALSKQDPRPDRGRPRLPIDRIFTMSGFGTVITGTLSGGSLKVGDEVEVQPSGKRARIRGLQSHKQTIDQAQPGSRVAVNLTGVDVEDIKRGDVLAPPGLLRGSVLVDVQFRHLADAERPLKHNSEVKFFSGSAETVAHVRLLGNRELAPGAEGWLQLRLSDPVVLDKGDRFILRYPSPPRTIGGGTVLDPHPPHRWRRFKPEVLARLTTLAAGTPEDLLLQTLEGQMALFPEQASAQAGLTADELTAASSALEARGDVFTLPGGWMMAQASWTRLADRLAQALAGYHETYPLRLGMPREALRSRMGVEGKLFGQILDLAGENGVLVCDGSIVRRPEHTVSFSPRQKATVAEFWTKINANPLMPPNVKEATEWVGEDVLQALFDRGDLVLLSPDVFLDAGTYTDMVARIESFITQEGSITVAQARDLFATTRKYALALLEHLDTIGRTKRVGDARVLGQAPTA